MSGMISGQGPDNVAHTVLTDIKGRIQVTQQMSSTGSTPATIASATGDTLLLAANANRVSFTLYNASTSVLYLLLGTGVASSTNYTLQVAASGTYENARYTGMVRGAWATANGQRLCAGD